jgi:chromosome partitioning protein
MLTVIGNLKGGSGKSTVTFNLAVWLAKAGEDPISFDLDPQSTLSDVAEVRQEEGHLPSITVYRAENDPFDIIRRHKGDVLVDVGASNLWAMRQAITLADRVLVPVTPSQADVWSTQRFLGIVADALKDNRVPEVVGFINRADTHGSVRETDETEEALSMLPGLKVQKTRLCQRTAFRRSFSEGLAVFELEGSGKAAQEFNRFARLLFPHLKMVRARRGAK